MDRTKIAIIKNWQKYNLPHVMCGFVDETDFKCFTSASVCFGDGSGIEVRRATRTISLSPTYRPARSRNGDHIRTQKAEILRLSPQDDACGVNLTAKRPLGPYLDPAWTALVR